VGKKRNGDAKVLNRTPHRNESIGAKIARGAAKSGSPLPFEWIVLAFGYRVRILAQEIERSSFFRRELGLHGLRLFDR